MIKQDLVKSFKQLGLEEGDNIFVTSSLSRFGYVEGGAETVIEALKECIGSGCIVMPSFNFSIFKKDPVILDLANTPSEMGLITETFRKYRTVVRTSNLFHPLCYESTIAIREKVIVCDTYDTWGLNSPYALFEKMDFKCVLLGTDFYSCPIMHYIEQKNNVPYREPIEYFGYFISLDTKEKQTCRRLRRKYGDSDFNCLYGLYSNLKEVLIGNSLCRSFEIKDMVNFCSGLLRKNPNFFLKQKSLLSPMPTMTTFDMMEAIRHLFKEPRCLKLWLLKELLHSQTNKLCGKKEYERRYYLM